jgi:ABC-type glycerol-3-phosphate transport system substrate-binding protein
MNDPVTLTRRRFLAGTGLAALGLALPGSLLSACGTDSSSGSGSANLKFWMDVAGAANQDYFKKHVIDPFEASQSKIKLNVTYYSGADLRRLISPTSTSTRRRAAGRARSRSGRSRRSPSTTRSTRCRCAKTP